MVVLPEQAPVLLQAAAIKVVLLPVAQSAVAVGQDAGGWQLCFFWQTAILKGSCRANMCQQLDSPSDIRLRLSECGSSSQSIRTLICSPQY